MVGAKIRDLRKKLGLTQEQLAGTQLTKSYVSQVELGRINPSPKALEIIAKRLGKPVGYFVENGDDLRTIDILLKAAQALWTSGRLDEGMLGLKEAMTLAERTGREDILARIKFAMGRIEMAQGHRKEAMALLEESLRLVDVTENPQDAVEIANTLGMVAARNSQFHRAMDAFRQALEFAGHLDDEHIDLRVDAAQHYGDFCFEHQQWLSAQELYEQALAETGPRLSNAKRAYLLARIANTQWASGHQTEALQLVDQVMSLAEQISQEDRAIVHADVARVFISARRYNEAHDLLASSLEVLEEHAYLDGAATVLDQLLLLAGEAKNDAWLTRWANRALTDAGDTPRWRAVKVRAYRLLARRAREAGNLEEADAHMRHALALASDETRQAVMLEALLIRLEKGDETALGGIWDYVVTPELLTLPRPEFTPHGAPLAGATRPLAPAR
ncbi:Transcriptional regulator [Candidatus Hydrogenisulfobacillus filiaventi]|uniref:Transcriptional regulator n=1 Tax=Candidatus Hydrogenisulfobacillus filiaventi TaxID=2707344 RepID=A0A6F8ZJ52_9FIRM|nr:helix-turn-helix domain-containing protein [Bacillota bacterium]CAB1129909.1 Transcriptional regulator [Candidatus Hydrogenisulfobacillus filiaventi]